MHLRNTNYKWYWSLYSCLCLSLLCSMGLSTTISQPALADGHAITSTETNAKGHHWVKAQILIKAPQHIVWQTVHEERSHDPDIAYSRVIEQGQNHCLLEQKFVFLPIFGSAVCLMKNTEVPLKRIDYSMVSSDHFKAMDGSWVLTATPDGNSTYLELSTHSDIGIPVPRQIMEGFTAKRLQKRLANVKHMAEAAQARIAARSEPKG